ncbi:MAG TPA: hypothetical protein VEG84_07870 [Thermoanaerobaculia bacterium]|nr:hypothetical protein [Thermoanaerobaculia bacterium]
MFGRDEKRGRVRSAVTLTVSLTAVSLRAAAARAQGRLEPLANGDSAIESVLRDELRAAGAKLADVRCRLIFSDFRDIKGRQIQSTLDTLGQTGQTYFRGLVFYDGYGRTACDSRETIAFTSPGSRAVFLCTPQFLAMAHRDQGLVADLLIHEELHSLGLGENPPSSKAITAGVVARCGK